VLFLVTKANAVLQQRFCKVDLNTRYQFRENETTLAVLAPLVFLYGLVAIPTALFATLRLCAVFPSSTNVLLKEDAGPGGGRDAKCDQRGVDRFSEIEEWLKSPELVVLEMAGLKANRRQF
uniref:RSN1_TM domain-containing protein n=1 Tax=Steinernema glaseri TaxID=37863 RepID=A0A1I8AT99_9BILA